ncbi:MAG: TldD/PmbA family protein [Cyanobacteria bacterium P01_E01_bin.34]
MATVLPALSNKPEQLVEMAIAAGAADVEVYWSASTTRQVTFEGNRLTQVDTVESQGIALRVWQEGRCGLAVACGPVDADLLVQKALAVSQLGQAGDLHTKELQLRSIELSDRSPASWDIEPFELTIDALVEIGREGIAQLRDLQPDVICNGELSWETATTGLLNSRGMACQFVDYSSDGYLGVEWVRGDDFLELDAGQSVSPRPGQPVQDLEVERWVEAIERRLQWAADFVEISGARYPVILLPSATELLLDSAVAALDGRQLARRASPWYDKQGGQVMSSLLSLSQHPLLGPFGVPFDDEGVATQAVNFVEDGVLQQGFCDRRFASILGVSSTGNGFRPGLNNYPEPGLVNLVLPEPSVSFAQLLARMGTGLLVERVMGNWGELSGEFSVTVELGYWVDSGKIVGRVKDVMLAGNAYSALNAVELLGASPDWFSTQVGMDWAGAYCVPSILVREMSAIARE